MQPTEAADYTPANPRPEVPEVGGDLTVASFNVLNYFTTIGSRGAESDFEFERQEAKIVSAIAAIDADVVGLIEIENSATDAAVATLVTALNDTMGPGTYAYIPTGRLGTDVITNALIYQPASVRTAGGGSGARQHSGSDLPQQQSPGPRSDVHVGRTRRAGDGRGEPPQVEGFRMRRAIPTPVTVRETATSRARPRPKRS